mmetsp:Transcript_31747/g.73684  ORF Transcript_31747/g.73684 Transcript_31747/m.73684 type:complete len:590 (-) Transcript_31747:82-1851(-)
MGCLASLIPTLYFRKWVAIDNSRLYVVQLTSYLLIFAAVVYLVSQFDYVVEVEPILRSDVWAGLPDIQLGVNETTLCQQPTVDYNYWPEVTSAWRFRNARCATVTSTFCADNSPSCVHRSSLVDQAPQETFFATSFTEEIFNGTTGTTRESSYLIPGIEDFTSNHIFSFQMDLPSSYYHMVLGLELLSTDEVVTVLIGHDGTELNRTTSSVGRFTVREALKAANVSLDDTVGSERLLEFPDNKDLSGSERPKIRVTGLDIVVTQEYANTLPDADYNGPVCKITMEANPTWMARTAVELLDPYGSTRTRTFHGIRLLFKRKGTFNWFQLNRIVYTLSLGVAWLQIPFFIVFYFAIYGLGTLSDVYTGFLYEDVNLHHEFNGVSSRMLGISFGFHDIHDVEEMEHAQWGASQHRVSKRMDRILEDFEELDVGERKQFTSFFFARCASKMASDLPAMRLQDYMRPHMTNENLLFEDVLQIVDSDSYDGNFLERLFMDASLKAFGATAENREAKLLGRERKKTLMSRSWMSHEQMMQHVRAEKSLEAMRSLPSLARSKYGQFITEEQMNNIEKALDLVDDTCSKSQRGLEEIP